MTFRISQEYLQDTHKSIRTFPEQPFRAGTIGGRTQSIIPNGSERRFFINQLLMGLPQSVADELSVYLKPVYLQRSDYLYQPNDRIDYIYFPESAVFSEYQMLDDGRTIEIALIGSESATGLHSVFSECTATNWTQVCTAGTAVKIEREIFSKAVAQHSSVKTLLNDQINSYIRQISHKVICNTHHSVEERLCTWLLMIADRCGAAPLKLTQEHMARVLGVYRPSITCIAQSLRERGLIDYVRGCITIRDRSQVIKAACSCYSEFSTARRPVAATHKYAPAYGGIQ